METVLYNAMNGTNKDFGRQSINTNNLANLNTPGFKGDMFQAQSAYMKGARFNTQAVTIQQPNAVDFRDGELITTGRDLDLAVQGKGWFAVQDSNGKEGYTRAGDFQLDENGMLTTTSGLPVLGDGGPISIPPAQRIEVGSDGTISIVPLDGDPNELAILDRIKLVKIDGKDLYKGDDGLMKLAKGGQAPSDASVMVINGALEGSNVNAIDQMVDMIAASREFDTGMRMMQTVDENAQKLAQVLQIA